MAQTSLTCIGCPMGCQLTVTLEGGTVVQVTGNTCKRGEDYARKEVTHPTRIVTSTVRVAGGSSPTVSVKTARDVPKESIVPVMEALKWVVVHPPVSIGDVVLENAAGTGVPVIATKDVS